MRTIHGGRSGFMSLIFALNMAILPVLPNRTAAQMALCLESVNIVSLNSYVITQPNITYVSVQHLLLQTTF